MILSDERFSRRRWNEIAVEVSTIVHVKDRFQVAICEPVEVDDDYEIFWIQHEDNTKRTFCIGYWSIHRLRALLNAYGSNIAQVELYYKIFSASLIIIICLYIVFVY